MLEDFFRDPLHLITLLAIVMLFFGGKRIADVGSSLGKGIRDFKREIRDDGDDGSRGEPSPAIAKAVTLYCSNCGAANISPSRFCINCGRALESSPTATQCPSCHSPVVPGSRFCNECGREVATTSPYSEGARAS